MHAHQNRSTMSSSMLRGLSQNDSTFKIVNVYAIDDNKSAIEIGDSDDDSDRDALHIEELIEIVDSDETDERETINTPKALPSTKSYAGLNSKQYVDSSKTLHSNNATPSHRTPSSSLLSNENSEFNSLATSTNHQVKPKISTAINETSIKPSNPLPWNTTKKATASKADAIVGATISFSSIQIITENSQKSHNNENLFEQARRGNSAVIEDVSLRPMCIDINTLPGTVEESFVYQCEFCSEHFSSDVALIAHCAENHTKDVNCKYCKKTFYREKDLHFHMRTHIKKGRAYKCRNCTGVFMKLAELHEHEKTPHNNENGSHFRCDICDRIFLNPKSFNEHKRRFMHEQCEVCLEYFSSKSTLLQHFSVHIKEKTAKYSCDQCDGSFATKILLKQHRSRHRLYECEMCSTKFRRKDDIKCHLRMDCSKRKLFECMACKKSFLDEANWKSHISNHYERNRCAFCSEKFLHNAALSEHLDLHDDIEHPYQCKLCSAVLLSKRIFNFHLKTHEEKTKFKCDVCNRWFRSRVQLEKHSVIHAKLSYNCTICQMKFSEEFRLDQHLKNHAIGDFHCDICKRSFRTRDSIVMHMIGSHYPKKKCHICHKEFKNQHRLITHLKSHYVKVIQEDYGNGM